MVDDLPKVPLEAEWAFSTDVLILQSEVLGRGAVGEVRAAILFGTPVAARTLHFLKPEFLSMMSPDHRRKVVMQLLRECDLLRRMRHPNIVAFMGVAIEADRRPVWLVSERLERTLFAALHVDGAKLAVEQEKPVLVGIARALTYIHKQRWILRNVTSRKVLLDAHGVAKLCGVSSVCTLSERARETWDEMLVGHPNYVAPEMKGGMMISVAVDVFSFGVIIGEVSARVKPCPGPEILRGYVLVAARERHAALLSAMRSPELREVAVACLADKPEDRPATAALLARLEVTAGRAVSSEYSAAHLALQALPGDDIGGAAAAASAELARLYGAPDDQTIDHSALELLRLAREPAVMRKVSAAAVAALRAIAPPRKQAVRQLAPEGAPTWLPRDTPVERCEELLDVLGPRHPESAARKSQRGRRRPLNVQMDGATRRGANSVVFRMVHENEIFVLKGMFNFDPRGGYSAGLSRLSPEYEMLARVPPHYNLVDLLHHFDGATTLIRPWVDEILEPFLRNITTYVVLRLYPRGDLQSMIAALRDRNPSPLYGVTDRMVLWWLVQLTDVVAHLGAHGVVHRDIKANNVFVAEDETLRLGDFGCALNVTAFAEDGSEQAIQFTHKQQIEDGVGNPAAVPPEVFGYINKGPPTAGMRLADALRKYDVFSVGRMLYDAVVAAFPDSPFTATDLPPLPASLSPIPRALLRGMVEPEHRRRLSAEEAHDAACGALWGAPNSAGVDRAAAVSECEAWLLHQRLLSSRRRGVPWLEPSITEAERAAFVRYLLRVDAATVATAGARVREFLGP